MFFFGQHQFRAFVIFSVFNLLVMNLFIFTVKKFLKGDKNAIHKMCVISLRRRLLWAIIGLFKVKLFRGTVLGYLFVCMKISSDSIFSILCQWNVVSSFISLVSFTVLIGPRSLELEFDM